MTVFITGAAGFIGSHLTLRLLERGETVVGLDNLNPYYDVALKHSRLKRLSAFPDFQFYEADAADAAVIGSLMDRHRPETVVHLAAQAGVRHSLTHPEAYVQSNLVGFANMLEASRKTGVGHFLYASSSSVYGANVKQPFSVEDRTDQPVSLYAATKKSNELMAYSYSHLFGMAATGMRFFTVYGPWGRPDMAYYSFARKIRAGEPIPVFHYGRMKRDFTYIDDAVTGIELLMGLKPSPSALYRLYNIGGSRPVALLDFIRLLERYLGRKAFLDLQPLQPGDVLETYADIEPLRRDTGFAPKVSLEEGLRHFTEWYLSYCE